MALQNNHGSSHLCKITTVPHIFAVVNIECPDDRNEQLKIYVSELILDKYMYISQ